MRNLENIFAWLLAVQNLHFNNTTSLAQEIQLYI